MVVKLTESAPINHATRLVALERPTLSGRLRINIANTLVTKSVKLEVDEQNKRLIQELPIDNDRLVATARSVTNGRPLSVASVTGRGRPLSRAEFISLRSWLIDNQYARWIDPANRRAGIELTARGSALFRALAE